MYVCAGWGIKISHILKRYKKIKEAIYKKAVYISEKYIKKQFL